jgi:hypothetical protein
MFYNDYKKSRVVSKQRINTNKLNLIIMKNVNLKLIIAILAISISFASCKKDKVDKESAFTLNNLKHKTDHGYIVKKSSNATSSVYEIFLCSPELNVSETALAGYGDFILLMFLSNSPTELLAGDYSYSGSLNGMIIISYDSDIDNGVSYGLNSTGVSTAKITINGTTYEIDYSLTLTTGKILQGYYKGSLTELATSPLKSGKLYSFEK